MDSSAVLRVRATNGGWCWMKRVHRQCFHSPPQRKRRGKDPLGSSHPSTAIGRTPRGSTAFKSARGRRNTPKPCHATRGRGDGQGRGGRGEAKGSVAACLGVRAAAIFFLCKGLGFQDYLGCFGLKSGIGFGLIDA
ncbi:hypothetical protein CXB51_031396 [Gossypium anomalum]|uniref:Uncharacterized protein n=1 Tax=Gossypium anomalum TaxID=47600 RepID=A0A8J6CL14_9ROSI|nr:hypothetical protein CXB51_031396 [Gossypium anomalum]